ncbi:MAG: BatD family protein [Prevotellaceae bacterium]|nr:BatD family protein [Prevotellaceae bacterium]
MISRVILTAILLIAALVSHAAISITAKAPATVGVGDQFRLQYVVNTANVGTQPQLGNITDFDIVYGPAVSTSHSVQIVNGNKSENSSTTYTFTLIARKEGTFQMPAVTLNIGGQNYTSNRPTVLVAKAGSATASQQSGSGRAYPQPQPQQRAGGGSYRISPGDLYIEVSADKKEVYEQEPLLLSYQVYTTQALEQLQGKMPDLKGFVAKQIPLPRDKQLTIVNHNGRAVQTTLWSQYVMFPQQSGKLTIPSIPFEGVIAFANRNIDPIDAFFFGTNPVTRVNHTVNAPSLDITVKPLPPKPANFSGAVGSNFAVSAALATKTPRENETLTLKVRIHGTGNIDLITPPDVRFPADFETLDNKPQANVKLTTRGMEGDLIVEYYAIPNHEGHFTIPPVELTYFSPADGQYHTVSSGQPIAVNVAKGNPNSYAARQRMKNDDIRHINLAPLATNDDAAKGSAVPMWLIYLLLVAIFIIIYKTLQVRRRRSADVEGRTLRRAGSKASALLRTARQMMEQGDAAAFYNATLTALRNFVADKLLLPPTDITKERIADLFAEYDVPADLTTRYVDLISDCELNIYGVSTPTHDQMASTYTDAEDIIAKLNPMLTKKKRRSRALRPKGLAILLLLVIAVATDAQPAAKIDAQALKANADTLYVQHHYAEAAEAYAELLKARPHDAQLLYNLGNCHYRLKDIPRAILAYERAAKLNPSDADCRHNLGLARAQTQDKFYSSSDLGIAWSFNSFVNTFGAAGWSYLAVAMFALLLAAVLVLRFASTRRLKKIAFAVILIALACIILFNIFSFIQRRKYSDHSAAIVLNTTKLMSTPDTTGTNLFTLHGGTKLSLSDTTLPAWSEVTLSDGQKGWVSNQDIEKI